MKHLARRGFLRIAGAAGLGSTQLPKAAAQIGASSFGAMGASHGGIPTSDAAPPWANTKLTEAVWKTISRDLEELDRRVSERCSYRVAGLDPDLYQRASGAHWWRVAVQKRRDAAWRVKAQEMRWQLWPRMW